MQDNLLCKCGHVLNLHIKSLNLGPCCNGCFEDVNVPLCKVYHGFKLDNLAYVVKVQEEREQSARSRA